MYSEIRSNKLKKSLRGISPLIVIITCFLPNKILAQTDCLNQQTISNSIIRDEQRFILKCAPLDWRENDIISVKSKEREVVGLFQVVQKAETAPSIISRVIKKNISDKKNAIDLQDVKIENVLKLISIKQERLLQHDDYFDKIDLTINNDELKGTSYLWKTQVMPSHTKPLYRPLLTQGETIGETAQTLWKNEYYFTVLGTIGYGILDNISVSANLTGYALGSPNGRVKGQVYSNENQTWSLSMSMAQERNSAEKLFNVDIMWDSILTDSLVAHSLISAAVISFDSAKEAAALKSYGNSSIQTGYEYILSDWSRFLIGPSYNIDQKAIGGYVGYVKIINNLHLQASLTTSNIRELKFSAKEGYFFILDAYWRW